MKFLKSTTGQALLLAGLIFLTDYIAWNPGSGWKLIGKNPQTGDPVFAGTSVEIEK